MTNNNNDEYVLYARRWWILFLLSTVSALQSCIWMTYSPVEKEAKEEYNFSKSDITLLCSWGPIIYVLMTPITPRIVDNLGLRGSIVLSSILSSLGCIIRCITNKHPYTLLLAHFGQILNAASGPFILTTPPKLSLEWFDPHSRNYSTSIGVLANYLGTGIGFLAALPIKKGTDLKYLLYIEALISTCITILCFIDVLFFNAKPLTPPSKTSAIIKKKINIIQDMNKIVRNRSFMILALSYGISNGIYSGWSGILDEILSPLNYTQNQASWLGFFSVIAIVLCGVLAGYIADQLKNVKYLLLLLYTVAALSFIFFCLLTSTNIINNHSLYLIYISLILSSFFLNAAGPISYESVIECVYPIDETTVSTVLTAIFNISSGSFTILAGYINPKIMNWILSGSCIISILLILNFEEVHRRRDIDDGIIDESQSLINPVTNSLLNKDNNSIKSAASSYI